MPMLSAIADILAHFPFRYCIRIIWSFLVLQFSDLHFQSTPYSLSINFAVVQSIWKRRAAYKHGACKFLRHPITVVRRQLFSCARVSTATGSSSRCLLELESRRPRPRHARVVGAARIYRFLQSQRAAPARRARGQFRETGRMSRWKAIISFRARENLMQS